MKLFPYPQPRLHLRRTASSNGSPEAYFDHSTRVIRWMGRNALRRITEFRKAFRRYPTVDELQSWLEDHCTAALDHFEDKYERMTQDAAIYALSAYDEAAYDVIVKRASKGGKTSRRGKTYTVDQLRSVQDLSIAKQAEALGCSLTTIKRLRASEKVQSEAEQLAAAQADYESCFGPEHARITRMPDTVPTSWVDEVHALVKIEKRERQDALSAADFDDLEVS
ncbi:hypothetical protein [Microbacterium sp. 22296]|uniref:hypothetical protein n=1 Tax=Microbacterium sp. 22296 TaxID=3453903 RepID=UPI003F841AC4